jgi:hypothetical protein
MASNMDVVHKQTAVTGVNYASKKGDIKKTSKSTGYSINDPAIASIETVVKDKYGVDKSPYTSSEELAVSSSKNLHQGADNITDSFVGVASSDIDTDKNIKKAETRQVLQAIKRFDMALHKLLQQGDVTIDTIKSALTMSISGVASLASGSQLVNTALIQDSVKHLSEIDKNAILKLSKPQVLNAISSQMIAIGLVLAARTTKASANESASKFQQQPKDSFDDMTNRMKTFIQDSLNTVESLASQNSQQSSQIDSHRKVDS